METPIQDLASFMSILHQGKFICITVFLRKKVCCHSHVTPSSSNHSICVRDCASGGPLDGSNNCGEIIEDAWVRLYRTVCECCQAEMNWKNADLCASESDPSSPGTLQFYLNQEEMKCVQDCPTTTTGGGPCGGPPKQLLAELFDNVGVCCGEKLPWLDPVKCIAATNGVPPPPPPGGNAWYVDWQSYKCVENCDVGPQCGGLKEVWDVGHPDADACCNIMLSWLDPVECIAASTGVPPPSRPDAWYVDWRSDKCVKDCDVGPQCGGLKEVWDIGWPTDAACCINMIPWVPTCY